MASDMSAKRFSQAGYMSPRAGIFRWLSARLQYLQCVSNGDYKNPLHLDVVDRYLRRMGDKTIPDEAPPSLESFYLPWVAGIDLPQSRCCGFFVSFTIKVYFKVKTQGHRCFVGCLTVVIHIRKWRLIACVVMVTSWRLFAMQNNECHQLRLKAYSYIQKYQTQLCICRSTTSVSGILCCVCLYAHKSRLTFMENYVT